MIAVRYIQNIGLNTKAQKELDDIKRLLKEQSE
jgi:hypothetical protein